MRSSARQFVQRCAFAVLPPLVMRYQIALRNYRRGEPEIRLLKDLVDPQRDAVDVGGYLGAYTFFLNRIARHVHVFEPQRQCARFLERAYPHHVTVHDCALADTRGDGAMLKPDPLQSYQSARLSLGKDAAEPTESVAVKCLDDFAFADVGFIKIDAEGAEERILRGAAQTISRCRPVLLVEIEERHLDKDIAEVIAFVLGLGYSGEYYHNGALCAIESFSVEKLQRARLAGDRSRPYINNFIFRPKSLTAN